MAEAQRQAQERISKVISTLMGKKIPEKDIQTIHFIITPVRQWIEEGPKMGKEMIIGYRVSNIYSRVKVREIAKAGEVIDSAIVAGGDLIRVQSISFTIDDPTALYKLAREKAIADAKSRAEELARLLGVEVGKATFISEGVPLFFLKKWN